MDNEDAINEILTPKQELFCRNYTQNETFYGNATLSYADAYGFDLDSQPKNDAQYQRTVDMQIYAEWELVNLDIEQIKRDKEYKKIQDSSYSIMYENCASYGSRLRKSFKIQERCRDLLNEMATDKVIDARLMDIAIKGKDADAINAIKEFNKLKGRIIDKKEITGKDGKDLIPQDKKDEIESALNEVITNNN